MNDVNTRVAHVVIGRDDVGMPTWFAELHDGDKLIRRIRGRTRQDAMDVAEYWFLTGMVDDSIESGQPL
jgi:hypothetical protein